MVASEDRNECIRPSGRGGIIRLPSMDFVSAAHQQSYHEGRRRPYQQRSYVHSGDKTRGGYRGACRQYMGSSSSVYRQQGSTTHSQRSDDDLSYNGGGNRSRSGSVSMSCDKNNTCAPYAFRNQQCDFNRDAITVRPRRSASEPVEIVDEDGFTLVTRGRHGSSSIGRGGYERSRGSSGDATSNSQHFYGSLRSRGRAGGNSLRGSGVGLRDCGRVTPWS
jgi:hypothetical protein